MCPFCTDKKLLSFIPRCNSPADYLSLLGLDDLDDISKVLNLHLILVANYWFAMEAIYPIGSVIVFLVFGKIAYEIGRL